MGRIVRVTTDSAVTVANSGSNYPLMYGAPASQMVRVIEAGWDAVSSEDAEQIETVLAQYTGTATGGSTSNVEATKGDLGDGAHGGTITHASTGGLTIAADSIIDTASGPINGGYRYRPIPEATILNGPQKQIAMAITTAPGASFTCRPYMVLELIGA
jgi:hypothetical protein